MIIGLIMIIVKIKSMKILFIFPFSSHFYLYLFFLSFFSFSVSCFFFFFPSLSCLAEYLPAPPFFYFALLFFFFGFSILLCRRTVPGIKEQNDTFSTTPFVFCSGQALRERSQPIAFAVFPFLLFLCFLFFISYCFCFKWLDGNWRSLPFFPLFDLAYG